MEGSRDTDHLLVLRVMRFTRPSFATSEMGVIPLDPDFSSDSLNPNSSSSPLASNFSLSPFLTMPQNFGTIYLGETFTCYLNVSNQSQFRVTDVVVKTDLQTVSHSVPLTSIATATPRPALDPSESVDGVLQHEVRQLGTHMLVCAVIYTNSLGEKLSFRKFFKFLVLKPFDVKAMFHEKQGDNLYLETQIQNTTEKLLFMERFSLEPSAQYIAEDLNIMPQTMLDCVKDEDSKTDSSLDSQVQRELLFLRPKSMFQMLYRTRPVTMDVGGSSDVGKVDIVWRSAMGERGRLQVPQVHGSTSTLQYSDVSIRLLSVPATATLERPFVVTCEVRNCSERKIDLVLSLDNGSERSEKDSNEDRKSKRGFIWPTIVQRTLPLLNPGEVHSEQLTLLPVACGLQSVSGVRLTDTFLRRTYSLDDLAVVMVTICSDA